MKNLLLYEEFNWFGKPKELDAEITEIINDIKSNFDINNLSLIENISESFFIYTYKGQSLKFGRKKNYGAEDITTYTWLAFLNEKYIRDVLSKKIIKNFFRFLKNKWYEKIKKEKNDNTLEIKNKLRILKDAEGVIGNEELDPLGEENWL